MAKIKTAPRKREGSMALWICTPFGILMPAIRPPHTVEPGDDRSLQVRARERAYLDTFRQRHCPELGESIHFPQHDYPWKAYVTREALAAAVAQMVLDIDSEIFKPLSESGWLPPRLASRLHSAYNAMWSTQLKFGDGTSSYDSKPDPARCERMGHWYPDGAQACADCGMSREVWDAWSADVHGEPWPPDFDGRAGGGAQL